MSTRFQIDLLHPGRVAQTWQEWFVGPQGARRLLLSALGAMVVLLLVLVAGILPTYWRLSADLNAIPRLQKDLGATEADLGLLRTNLRALTEEARRQVRWAELLTALSQHIPPTLRLVLVESARPTPIPGVAPPPGQARTLAGELRLESLTPVRPGSPPLLDIAQFMAGLMRDPSVNRRFVLKAWEIRPPTGTGEEAQFLNIAVTLQEKAS